MAVLSWRQAVARLLIGAAGVWLAGCGGDDEPAPPSAACPPENLIGDLCAGVPAGDICGADTCTEGVTCAAVVNAASDAALASAADSAAAGACIALAPGHYSAVTLPGGVSLLGRSAASVSIDGVTLGAGDGAVLRGLRVGTDGVRVQGAGAVRIESVRITGERGVEVDGLALDAGSAVMVSSSEIAASGRAGIFATDAAVTLDRSVIHGAQLGGIRFQGSGCEADCNCASRPALIVTNSVIRDNHVIGIAVNGATLSLEGSDVTGSKPGDAQMTGQYGAGVSAAACSNIVGAKDVRVRGNTDWGLLVDDSTGTLGSDAAGEGIEISENLRGLWIQNVNKQGNCPDGATGCVSLHGATLDGNRGVGIGVSGAARGIILCRSAISSTSSFTMPVFDGMSVGQDAVGDGVDWLGGSVVTIEELSLSGNARQSLLIDGPAEGDIGSVSLSGGDEGKPPVQQSFTAGDAQPIGIGTPVATDPATTLGIPQDLPTIPAP